MLLILLVLVPENIFVGLDGMDHRTGWDGKGLHICGLYSGNWQQARIRRLLEWEVHFLTVELSIIVCSGNVHKIYRTIVRSSIEDIIEQ